MLRSVVNMKTWCGIGMGVWKSHGLARRWAHLNGNQVKTGMALEIDGKIYRVMKSQTCKPGKGGAFNQTLLKEIPSGSTMNKRFRASESVRRASLGSDVMYQYLYSDGDKVILMDQDTFDQMEISLDLFDKTQAQFLTEGMEIAVQKYEGVALMAKTPQVVVSEVAETIPHDKSMNSNAYKDAVLTCGASIKIPPFVEVGEAVKVSTETGEYMERA